jgi:hypothetical protein
MEAMATQAVGTLTEVLLSSIAAIAGLGHRAALDICLRRHGAVRLIRAVLDDDDLLHRAAYASYKHANGFDKLILASSPQGHVVKLDVWWPDEPRGQEDIHNHRYSFSSHLLLGELSMEHWEFRDTGTPMDYLHIEVAGGRTDRLEHLGQRTVERLFDIRATAGDTYSLHHAQLHRVAARPGSPSATLVFQDRNARNSSEVLRPPASGRPEQRYNPPFEPAQLAAKLERLLSHLDDGS